MQVCILCNHTYDLKTINLEQRLINDRDFCTKCWNEFMTIE